MTPVGSPVDPAQRQSRRRRPRTMQPLACLLLIVVLLPSCADPSATSPPGDNSPVTAPVPDESTPTELGELAAARSRWEANASSDYHYVFEDDCGECEAFSGQVVVWDGEVLDPSRRSLAVEEIFDILERAAAAGQSVEAVFDQETGYPTDVWIDRESRAFDGGTHWIIEDLVEGLPGEAASLAGLEAAWARWKSGAPTSLRVHDGHRVRLRPGWLPVGPGGGGPDRRLEGGHRWGGERWFHQPDNGRHDVLRSGRDDGLRWRRRRDWDPLRGLGPIRPRAGLPGVGGPRHRSARTRFRAVASCRRGS